MLIDLLRAAAVDSANRPFLTGSGFSCSFAECHAAAGRMAAALAARGFGRFGIRATSSPDLIALWFGAAWMGIEACILDTDGSEADVEGLVTRLDFTAVVSDRPLAIGGTSVFGLEEIVSWRSEPPPPPAPDASVLILTSGTTGHPKAARYLWSRLVAQARRSPSERDARWLLAYDLNHFAGVQMVLHALVNRSTLVLSASASPKDAIVAMTEGGVTHVSATPTFWRFLLAQLSESAARALPLEQITLGAEAAGGALFEDLRLRFPAARISQIFAATEVGSCVAVTDGRPGLPVTILERSADADVQFRIVDGELHIRSRNGMLGYHGETTAPEWRATGDRVEVRGDRIVFVGRASETINVGGVKVHPLPIEERLESVAGLKFCRAYGRPNPITGEIVALDVVAEAGAVRDDLEARIRAACQSLPRAAQPRAIRFVDALEMRNRKLSRRRV